MRDINGWEDRYALSLKSLKRLVGFTQSLIHTNSNTQYPLLWYTTLTTLTRHGTYCIYISATLHFTKVHHTYPGYSARYMLGIDELHGWSNSHNNMSVLWVLLLPTATWKTRENPDLFVKAVIVLHRKAYFRYCLLGIGVLSWKNELCRRLSVYSLTVCNWIIKRMEVFER